MTDREIMQQALDYIKETYNFCVVMQQPKEQEEQLIKALEAALAQPEIPMSPEHLPQYIATNNIKPTTEGGGGAGGAQPEQDKLLVDLIQEQRAEIDRLRQALAQPEQEPVAIHCPSCLHSFSIVPVAKREWFGLTDEEILSAAKEVPITCIRQRDYDLHFAPIIEAKLKDKNTT